MIPEKKSWVGIKIGDIVEEVREFSHAPLEEGFIQYIGFEHIQSNNLIIHKFGDLSDGVTFRRKFRKGDVLFGRIRAYLKKVAIAPIDGICSNDILVLRTKNQSVLIQELLPYFVTNQQFFKRAIDASIGTTLPRVKWQNIASHVIHLPPFLVQRKIVELFRGIDLAIVQTQTQEERLKLLRKNLQSDIFSGKKHLARIIPKNHYELFKFEDIANQISERVDPNKTDSKIYVGLEHLESDNLMIEKTGSPDEVVGTKLKVSKGDIIFGKRRAYQRKVAVSHFDGIASAHSMILRPNEQNIERDFLPYFMQSDEFMNRAVQISEGSLSPTIKWKTLAAQEFLLPRKDKQPQLIELFKQLDKTTVLLKKQKSNLKKLKQQLLNEILG